MSTGEGADPRSGAERGDERPVDRIGVGGGDDSVSRIQLAARWAEAYGTDADSLVSVLKRFRTAYEYLDAVIHGVDPPELPSETPPVPRPAPAYASAPPPQQWSNPAPPPAPAPEAGGPPPPWQRPTEPGAPPSPAPPPEPRPWG
jgi:hypothetical protein